MHAEGTYESRMSNLTSRCSQMESTAATVIASEVPVVSVVGRTRRWLPYMHWGLNSRGFVNRNVRVGWYRVLQLVSAPLLADAEPHPLVLPDCHCLNFGNVFYKFRLLPAEAGMRSR